MFMFLLECWTSEHLKHHKKLPRRVKNALNNTAKQKKPPTHPNKQTNSNQVSLCEVKCSLFTKHFNLLKIEKKNTFISETGAQGLIMWGGEGGGS